MHWLYWNRTSPRVLDEVGVSYDSTFGYNDAIGFRAGTTQPFRPLTAERLLELQLNIQDSAMFYPDRMKLSDCSALTLCKAIILCLSRFGGILTINWHTRSLSPERLWGDFYVQLLRDIQTCGVRFGTAEQILGWFRKRRAVRFDCANVDGGEGCVTVSSPLGHSEPSFTVRIHRPESVSRKSEFSFREAAFRDHHWTGENAWKLQKADTAH
jgi:hypothetical protein